MASMPLIQDATLYFQITFATITCTVCILVLVQSQIKRVGYVQLGAPTPITSAGPTILEYCIYFLSLSSLIFHLAIAAFCVVHTQHPVLSVIVAGTWFAIWFLVHTSMYVESSSPRNMVFFYLLAAVCPAILIYQGESNQQLQMMQIASCAMCAILVLFDLSNPVKNAAVLNQIPDDKGRLVNFNNPAVPRTHMLVVWIPFVCMD